MTIFKTLTVIALLTAGCGQVCKNRTTTNMDTMDKAYFDRNKCEIPENTLSVIESEGRTIYLTGVERVPTEVMDVMPDSWLGKAEHSNVYGYSFICFTFAEGCYPANYTAQSFFLQYIPEGEIFRLKLWAIYFADYKNGETIEITSYNDSDGQWESAGYSTDNSLWAKVFEYYQKNIEQKIQ